MVYIVAKAGFTGLSDYNTYY